MRWLMVLMLLTGWLGFSGLAESAEARVVKVLPHYLDLQGRHTLSPSLYERDAYQAELRKSPDKCSGLRFDVQWKEKGYAADKLKLKVEIRASKGTESKVYVLEQAVKPKGFLGYWAAIPWTGDEYKAAGTMNAWRVTLWEGDTQIAEQKSFLW